MNKRYFFLLTLGLLPALLQAQTRDPALYGRAYLAEGDTAGAIENYQEAAKINPFDPVALNNLAVARAAAGDYQAALDLLAKAIKLAPGRTDISENHRQLQSWMNDQLLGGPSAAIRRPVAAQSSPQNFGIVSEPPPLWQRGTNENSAPAFRTGTSDQSMSYSTKKKSKRKYRKSSSTCAPKLPE